MAASLYENFAKLEAALFSVPGSESPRVGKPRIAVSFVLLAAHLTCAVFVAAKNPRSRVEGWVVQQLTLESLVQSGGWRS